MEFVEGLLNLCLLDMPISQIQSLKLLQLLRAGMAQLDEKVQGIAQQLEEVQEQSVIQNARV